jgi:hypothetical protein
MEKTLIKSMFGYDSLKDMKADDVISVVCSTWLERASVISLVSQCAKAHPDYGTGKFKTESQQQGTCYIVKVTAVA